ncbi:MAG TPA: tetratricopeptide repeat protein [Tepidisphaeraceae bacterium]|jgi:predicted O-linked N-acetylglucosamine transferase (SPINDLY family)|nr:tetratricopeptide repeat protein [Tepidisphaeraceae bacterium]
MELTVRQAMESALAHHRANRIDQAEQTYRLILNASPNEPDALEMLGALLSQRGRHGEGLALIDRALALRPHAADYHANRGLILSNIGRNDEAVAAYRAALALRPDSPIALYNLGNSLLRLDQDDEAMDCYQRAVALAPNEANIYGNLGNLLLKKDRLDDAIAAYRRASELSSDHGQPRSQSPHLMNLARALIDAGQLDEAISNYRRVYSLRSIDGTAPQNVGSEVLFLLSFLPGYDARRILQEHRDWNAQLAEGLRSAGPHENDRSPQRRLRIGYVSPNFRNHVQSLFTVPLFSRHDHQNFEIYCYADVRSPDSLTLRLRGCADVWRNIAEMTDQQVTDIIRCDCIDILVDLTLHMADNRMLVFARKPAPVQVTWLGYPGTTGLETIDYRLTDPYLDPPGETDAFYVERSIRLPHTFWCIDLQALEPADTPPVNPLPALEAGKITFGCFNTFSKINQPLLELWARVLNAVPNSRMLMLAPSGSRRQWVSQLLSDRVDFISRQPRNEYLKFYHRVDLGLDTLPSNGHTTSLDSFWMGVPVVTLIGNTVVGRAGFSQLSNLQLSELVAKTADEYVTIAAKLAADLPKLAELRRTLRERMRFSLLMDADRFTRDIESAYRQMWLTWCKSPNNGRAG